MRYLCTLLLLLFFSVESTAQYRFTGKVVDSASNKAVGWASVVAEDSAHKPLGFTQTKDDGTFSLTVPKGKNCSFISFSMIGYSKKTLPVGRFSNGQTISLNESSLELKEVKVTSKRLRKSNDTLTYSVAGFRQKQDRSIADVIAKMPGLEVTDNGTIKYQGKAISDFYIEGLDLMGSNYSLASENLNAMKVKDVQILTNHQRVQALRDVQFSDKAALNLVLEEDARNTWMGVLEAGSGMTLQESPAQRLLRDGRLMAMMFGGKAQTISMYKWNNTGKDISNEVKSLTSNLPTMDATNSMTSDIAIETPELGRNHYLMNDSHLLATNWLRKTSNHSTLRLQISGIIDQTLGHRETKTEYSDLMGATVVQEQVHGKRNRSEWKGEMKYETNDTNIFINNVLSGYIDFNKGFAESKLNETSVRQQSEPQKKWINWNSQIVKTLWHDQMLQLNASAGYSYMPGNLMLQEGTIQHINQHATQAAFNALFRHKLFGGVYVAYQAGMDYTDQRFELIRGGEPRQDDSYQQLSAYLTPSMNLTRHSMKWTLRMPLRIVNRHLGNIGDTRVVAEPSINMEYQMSSMLTARASYAYNWQPSMLTELTSVPIYTNYLSYTTGIGELYASENHRGSMRLEYTNAVNGLFGNIEAAYTYIKKEPVYRSSLDGLMFHRATTNEYRNRSSWLINGRVSKALPYMKLMIALDGIMVINNSTVMIGGRQLPYRNDNLKAGVSASFRPMQLLSFEAKSSLLYAKHVSTSNHAFDSRAVCSFKHELKLFVLPDKWQIELDNEFYRSHDHSVPFCHFADIRVSYRAKKLEAGLSLENIFGTKNYERQYVSNYATTCMVSRLRPREVLAKVSFDL